MQRKSENSEAFRTKQPDAADNCGAGKRCMIFRETTNEAWRDQRGMGQLSRDTKAWPVAQPVFTTPLATSLILQESSLCLHQRSVGSFHCESAWRWHPHQQRLKIFSPGAYFYPTQ